MTNVASWVWVQPKTQEALLSRLADARDLDVPGRERENLCACAYTEIKRLQQEILIAFITGFLNEQGFGSSQLDEAIASFIKGGKDSCRC